MSESDIQSGNDLSESIEKILLAAEIEFSERGFEGAGMKAISKRAQVSQALLHYHFGTKERLYSEVIGQRSQKINKERLALLGRVDLDAPDALDRILEALFGPPLGPVGGGKAYARILGGLVVGHEREQALVEKYYDPTARQFVRAIQEVVPGADQAVAALCYSFSLGVLVAAIGRNGRVERLMGRDELQDTESMLRQLVIYAKGGVHALAQSYRQ